MRNSFVYSVTRYSLPLVSNIGSVPPSLVRVCVLMSGPFKAVGCVRTPFCCESGRAPFVGAA